MGAVGKEPAPCSRGGGVPKMQMHGGPVPPWQEEKRINKIQNVFGSIHSQFEHSGPGDAALLAVYAE